MFGKLLPRLQVARQIRSKSVHRIAPLEESFERIGPQFFRVTFARFGASGNPLGNHLFDIGSQRLAAFLLQDRARLIKNVCQIEQNVRHRYPRPSLGRPPRNCWAEGARRILPHSMADGVNWANDTPRRPISFC